METSGVLVDFILGFKRNREWCYIKYVKVPVRASPLAVIIHYQRSLGLRPQIGAISD